MYMCVFVTVFVVGMCVYSFIWQVCGYLNFVFIKDVLYTYVCVCVCVRMSVVCACVCSFIWQVCGYLPTTMPKMENETDVPNDVLLKATQLTASFVLETLIHSKEKVRVWSGLSNSTCLLYV